MMIIEVILTKFYKALKEAMILEKIFKATPFILFFLFVTVPMLSISRDMWDGTIIEYASIIDDYAGLKSFFFESTWFSLYPFSLAIIEVSKLFNVSYKNMNAFVVLVFMFFFLRETFWLAKYQIKLSKPAAYFALALVATFSTWGSFFSSIMTFHLGCMVLGLFSIRQIHKRTVSSTFIGFTALLTSLSLQSQLVFLPVLSYIYDLSERNRLRQLWFINPSKQTVFIFVTCITFYTVIQQFYPPHGLYENVYNLTIGSFEGLAVATYSVIIFSTYLIPVFLIIIIIGCISLLVSEAKKKMRYNSNWLVWLLVIFFAGLFPYAAVGKSSSLWSIGDWLNRHAFLLVLPTCLFTALCLQFLYENFSSRVMRNCVLGGGFVIFLFHLTLLTISIVHKSNRQVFVTHLENLIQKNENRICAGLLEIVGSNIPNPQLRFYESNFLMYSATGKANWWTRVGSNEDEKFIIPDYVKRSRDYQIKYVYNYEPRHANNHTVVEINTSGFQGPLNIIGNFLGINPPGIIELIRISTKPAEPDRKVEKSCN